MLNRCLYSTDCEFYGVENVRSPLLFFIMGHKGCPETALPLFEVPGDRWIRV